MYVCPWVAAREARTRGIPRPAGTDPAAGAWDAARPGVRPSRGRAAHPLGDVASAGTLRRGAARDRVPAALPRAAGRVGAHALGRVPRAGRGIRRGSPQGARRRVLRRGRRRHPESQPPCRPSVPAWCSRAPPPAGRWHGGPAPPAARSGCDRDRLVWSGWWAICAPPAARRRGARAHPSRAPHGGRDLGPVRPLLRLAAWVDARARARLPAGPGREAGPAERDMLLGVFSLADTTVAEVMTPRIDIVAVDSSAGHDEVIRDPPQLRARPPPGLRRPSRRDRRRDLRQGHPGGGPTDSRALATRSSGRRPSSPRGRRSTGSCAIFSEGPATWP